MIPCMPSKRAAVSHPEQFDADEEGGSHDAARTSSSKSLIHRAGSIRRQNRKRGMI